MCISGVLCAQERAISCITGLWQCAAPMKPVCPWCHTTRLITGRYNGLRLCLGGLQYNFLPRDSLVLDWALPKVLLMPATGGSASAHPWMRPSTTWRQGMGIPGKYCLWTVALQCSTVLVVWSWCVGFLPPTYFSGPGVRVSAQLFGWENACWVFRIQGGFMSSKRLTYVHAQLVLLELHSQFWIHFQSLEVSRNGSEGDKQVLRNGAVKSQETAWQRCKQQLRETWCKVRW